MYVSIKPTVKDVFDGGLKSAALAALSDGIRDAVDAVKGFSTKKPEDRALVLTASTSVTADDKAKPRELTATVAIDGVLSGGTTQGFKASGSGMKNGLNAKKLDRDVADLVDSVVVELMRAKVIPYMLKLKP